MWKSKKLAVLMVALTLGSLGVWRIAANGPAIEAQRAKLTKAYNDGNWKVAYDGLRLLALNPKNDPTLVGKDLGRTNMSEPKSPAGRSISSRARTTSMTGSPSKRP